MADTISGHGQPGPPPCHDIQSRNPGSCCRHHVPSSNHHEHHRRQEEEATGADSSRSDDGEPAGAASPRGDLQQPRGGVEDASSSKHVPLAQRLRDNRRLTQLVGHKDRTFHLSFHPNGQLLASASEDCSVLLWDVTTGAVRQRVAQESEVLRVAWSGPLGGVDRVFLASASSTGKVRVWNVAHEKVVDGQKKEPVMRPECELSHGEESQVYACKFLDDSTLLTASDDMVHFWNLETKTKIGQWRFDQLSTGSAFGGSVRNPNNLCYVFDVECGALHAGASRNVLCVALSDGSVRVQDLRTSQAVAILRKTGGAHLTSLRLGPSASALVSCGGNGECTLWDTRNWSIRATLQGHTRPVYGAEFLPALLASPSGRAGAAAAESLLMTWSTDETLRLWDVATAQGHVSPRDTILQPGFPILTCALSPLADRLAIGGGSGDAHAGHKHAANGACCGANGSHGQLSSGTSILLRQL